MGIADHLMSLDCLVVWFFLCNAYCTAVIGFPKQTCLCPIKNLESCLSCCAVPKCHWLQHDYKEEKRQELKNIKTS